MYGPLVMACGYYLLRGPGFCIFDISGATEVYPKYSYKSCTRPSMYTPADGVLRGLNGVVMSSLPVCVTQTLGLWLWNFRCMPMQIVHVLLCAPVPLGFERTKSRLNLWPKGLFVWGLLIAGPRLLNFRRY